MQINEAGADVIEKKGRVHKVETAFFLDIQPREVIPISWGFKDKITHFLKHAATFAAMLQPFQPL